MPPSSPSQPLTPPPHGTGLALVTGAGGFIGGHVAAALEQSGWRVAALGRRPFAAPWAEGDLHRDRLRALAADLGRPELAVHCAGTGSVRAAEDDQDGARRRTVGGLEQLLAGLAESAPAARLVLLSSAAVYGEGEAPKDERSTPPNPISAYGRHKLEAETAALSSGLDVAVVRFFSIYGPGLRKQLFFELYRRLAAGPETLPLGGTGQERRDFLYIDDAVRLIGLLAALPAGARPRVVNGGSGRPTSVREAAEALARAMASPARVEFSGEVRAGDPKVLVADPARARALGFEPEVGLDEGLARYVAWASAALEIAHG